MEQAVINERSNRPVELVTFLLGGSLYGIDILRVQEINKLRDWTSVPHSEDFVLGILSLRGSIVTILDLACKLGLPRTQRTENTRNIVINSEGQECVGFLVDGIGSVTSTNWDQVCDPPPNVNGVQGRFLEGVLKTDEDLIAILNVDEVFSEGELKSQEGSVHP